MPVPPPQLWNDVEIERVMENGHATKSADETFERDWWGDCTHTLGEEAKQISYAARMGLTQVPNASQWPLYDLAGKSVLDLGGGPVSLLLKTINGGRRTVVDPCPYPDWVRARYEHAGVMYVRAYAEHYDAGPPTKLVDAAYDEAWIYNVLLHTTEWRKIIEIARRSARTVRIFEWLDTAVTLGHPTVLHGDDLDSALATHGQAELMTGENGCWGTAYYAVT